MIDILDTQLAAGHWNQVGAWTGADSWLLGGNAGTDPSTHFVGTTDGQNLIVQPGAGRVGIGTTSPIDGKLAVAGGGGRGVYATSASTDPIVMIPNPPTWMSNRMTTCPNGVQ